VQELLLQEATTRASQAEAQSKALFAATDETECKALDAESRLRETVAQVRQPAHKIDEHMLAGDGRLLGMAGCWGW